MLIGAQVLLPTQERKDRKRRVKLLSSEIICGNFAWVNWSWSAATYHIFLYRTLSVFASQSIIRASFSWFSAHLLVWSLWTACILPSKFFCSMIWLTNKYLLPKKYLCPESLSHCIIWICCFQQLETVPCEQSLSNKWSARPSNTSYSPSLISQNLTLKCCHSCMFTHDFDTCLSWWSVLCFLTFIKSYPLQSSLSLQSTRAGITVRSLSGAPF